MRNFYVAVSQTSTGPSVSYIAIEKKKQLKKNVLEPQKWEKNKTIWVYYLDL